MTVKKHPFRKTTKSGKIHLAIIGGDKNCGLLLEYLKDNFLPIFDIRISGVYDPDLSNEGITTAREMGIYTTDNLKTFFKLQPVDCIIELTNDERILLELIRHKPKDVGIIDYHTSKLMRFLFDSGQEKLQYQEQLIALEKTVSDFLMEMNTDPIVILNTDFTIAEANEAFIDSTGKTPAQIIGSHCYQTIYGYDRPCPSANPEYDCPMIETLRTGRPAHVIHERPISQKKPLYNNVVSYPVHSQAGEIVKIIEIWHDITEEFLLRWEKKSKELKEDLNKLVHEDRMVSLGKLSASCVHEINNPIQGLLTFSHLMEKMLSKDTLVPEDLENMRSYASMMSGELERCGNIISGLLSFSRETPKEYKILDINEILGSVLSLTQHKMSLSQIELKQNLSKYLITVYGDHHQLQQCFLNLIFNAMESMPNGGSLTVTSQKDPARKSCLVSIQDSGYGISDEILPHIFDPFFTEKKTGTGTGLGLSIVYGVIKSHSGDINVESKKGKGTLFTLSFPIKEDRLLSEGAL